MAALFYSSASIMENRNHINVIQNTNNGIILHMYFKDDAGQYSNELDISIITSKRVCELLVTVEPLPSDKQLDNRILQVSNTTDYNNKDTDLQTKMSETTVLSKTHQHPSQINTDSRSNTVNQQIINQDKTFQTKQQSKNSAFTPLEIITEERGKDYSQSDDVSSLSGELPDIN